MKVTQLFAILGLASAECPNACSGHGTCGAKDSCSCYQNYQGNDCSERTCYFGIAHVDTPKGDLNADGYVSGPLTTVITGSEVYPWGTTEQYPNADANEGHFYMECSNKGMCDRKTGTCDCFDGYEGTACVRASCPNECSGHGTCESIKELAEQKSYNTNAHDVPTTTPVGSAPEDHHNFDLAIEESYAYDLWDQDKTLGCKCDPVYYGADCSLKKCKYGVDPLFYDNADGVIKQTSVIHLGSKSTQRGAIGGSFRIVFYDVFGEKYVTKQISTAASADAVRQSLENLPNGVISHSSTDITGTPPAAVTVSQQANGGTVTKTGTIGQGEEGSSGAGLGCAGLGDLPSTGQHGSFGPEYTVTFSTNPGILKSIELDTREINNPGSPDYWVANTRQGQFSSRYSNNLGRVNTLKYGSKFLYTNSDWDEVGKADVDTLVKIGGQEARVVVADEHHLELSEPFLGASIIPVLTDTGVATHAAADPLAALTLGIVAPGTTIIANHLKSGAKLYSGQCPFTTTGTGASVGADITVSTVTVDLAAHDCNTDAVDSGAIVYRRSDDPSNQNLYRTTADTGTETDPLLLTRGSSDVYVVSDIIATSETTGYSHSTSAFTTALTLVDDDEFFVNGHGPFEAISATEITAASGALASDIFTTSGGELSDLLIGADGFNIRQATSDTKAMAAGNILMLAGRRYKIASVGAQGAVANSKVTLTERFAGGQLLELCSNCITTSTATSLTSSSQLDLAVDDRILVGGFTHEDNQITVTAATADSTAITMSAGTSRGFPSSITNAALVAGTATAALYQVLHTNTGYVGTLVTESDTAATFQYVSQCANRGTCDSSTGICKCFKGYSNDNCDNQNMLAM
jgi:hypothetical protein